MREKIDQSVLEGLNLANPDEQREHVFDWPDDFLQRILGSFICDRYFLLQSMGLIKPQYFRENAHQFLCRTVIDYYNEYNDQPDKVILRAEIEKQFRDHPSKELYLGELEAVCDCYHPGLEKREYFLDRITEFAKTQALRLAYNKTLAIFKSDQQSKWDTIREILQEAMMVERNVDLGLDYFDTVEERYKRVLAKEDKHEFFPTGFESFDTALKGGISRGEIGSFAGMSGSGKSLCLAKVAKANVLKGYNVLYITLEIEEDKLAERIDAMLTAVPIKALHGSSKEVVDIIQESKSHYGRLFIKQFPAGTADVTTCRAFINHMHLHGFRPDVVIVDYVGEMRDVPGIKTYESRQRLIRDLRGLAVELKIAVFTAMQVNRGGRDALKTQEYLDDDLLADSAGQVRPLDLLITISQTPVEEKANCVTAFLSKNRSGKGRFLIRCARDPDTLEMSEITNERWKQECSRVADRSANELMMEDYARETWAPNRGNLYDKMRNDAK